MTVSNLWGVKCSSLSVHFVRPAPGALPHDQQIELALVFIIREPPQVMVQAARMTNSLTLAIGRTFLSVLRISTIP